MQKLTSLMRLSALVLALIGSGTARSYAATLEIVGGGLEFILMDPPGTFPGSGVRGNALLAYMDPGLTGGLFVIDLFGFPLPSLLASDLGLSDSIELNFDLSNILVIGPNLFVEGVGFSPTPVIDPTLNQLLSTPFVFHFDFYKQTHLGGAEWEYRYQMVRATSGTLSNSVPEPKTAVLVLGAGMVGVLFRVAKRATRHLHR
jgi:hypothetical protein